LAALALTQPGISSSLAGTASTPAISADVFDLEGRQIIQDEDHLGIVNGKLTTGINYRDVAGLAGLWAPPYVSSNFILEARVNGEKVTTTAWRWRPFQVRREGSLGQVNVSSSTTLIYGERAAVLSFKVKNSGPASQPFELFSLGWLDRAEDWGFARPVSRTETIAHSDGARLTLRQGPLAIVLTVDSPNWRWAATGNLGHATARPTAGQTLSLNVVIAIGPENEAVAASDRLVTNPANAVTVAEGEYARRVAEIFERLPVLESDNAQLVRWYNRSLVHLLMNHWEVPEFVLHPYYSTGSVKAGCVANYLWNFGEVWEILPLFDAPAARSHIQQFLKCDLLKHFLFNPVTGKADGPWYMVNQEKIIGLTYYYVLLTGDTAFLNDTVDGKSVRDHMVLQAMFGDDEAKPVSLIDYGPSNSHLELRRRFAYNHVMPDLNARRYSNYQRAATLCELAGRPAPFLRERAEQLKAILKLQLWDPSARWFRFEDGHGHGELRYTVQIFKPLGSGVLDRECEEGLLSHFNDDEFLSAFGLHSISKRDPAFDQLDIDNGGGGICVSFPPQIIERLYQAKQPKLAADILSRLLWWGDSMPYWGDSVVANSKDYRRDTPLQCTLDGAAAAQSIIFGVFGVAARPDGNVVIKPNRLPFAPRVVLRGLRLRGQTLEIRVEDDRYEVHSGERVLQSAIGQATLVSSDHDILRLAE
jgi:hypothetical protein